MSNSSNKLELNIKELLLTLKWWEKFEIIHWNTFFSAWTILIFQSVNFSDKDIHNHKVICEKIVDWKTTETNLEISWWIFLDLTQDLTSVYNKKSNDDYCNEQVVSAQNDIKKSTLDALSV